MNTTAVLFSGKVLPEFLAELIEQTKHIKNKVASIWDNENPTYIQTLIDNKFTIITNYNKQQELFTPQFIPIVAGLNWIKENGFDYVLKTRFDIVSTDYVKYINIIQKLPSNKITVIAGIETNEIFFSDIIVYGNVTNMCRCYTLQSLDDTRYPEKFIIENYSNKINLAKEDIKQIFNFSLNECIDNNIEFIWYRFWSSPPQMRVIKDYCAGKIIWI